MAEFTRVHARGSVDIETIESLIALDVLPADWRSYLEQRLAPH